MTDQEMEAKTIPSPAGAQGPCRHIAGCQSHALPGHARCRRHSSTMIPAVKLPAEFTVKS